MVLEAEHGIKASTLGVFNGSHLSVQAEVQMLLQLVAKLAGKSWAIGIDLQPEQNLSPTGRDNYSVKDKIWQRAHRSASLEVRYFWSGRLRIRPLKSNERLGGAAELPEGLEF